MPSEVIYPVQFSQPRAEKVRAPENMSEVHSAVHGSIAVYTDNKLETDYVIENWRAIMADAADKAEKLLSEFRVKNGGVPVGVNPETGFPFDKPDGLDFPDEDNYTGPTFRESDD